jgi:alpha-L-fucosidase
LNRGDRPGTNWVPAECDVSIRPGWFYHKHEDGQVKTPQQLVELYYASVGRGASLLLNLPPDRRGKIPENDAESLRGFRQIIDATFSTNLATTARLTASNWRGGRDRRFAPANVLDGSRITYWATDDGVRTPSLTLDLDQEIAFNVVRLREHLPLGQRVESTIVDSWQNGAWVEFGRATSIGNCRLIRGPKTTTTRVRLRITQAAVSPAISEFGLFSAPS